MPTVTGDAETVFAPAMTSTVGVFGALLTLQLKAGAGGVMQLTANGS